MLFHCWNKNEKSFNELLSKAKQLYPGDEIWVDIELKAVEEKGGKKAVISKYLYLSVIMCPSPAGIPPCCRFSESH